MGQGHDPGEKCQIPSSAIDLSFGFGRGLLEKKVGPYIGQESGSYHSGASVASGSPGAAGACRGSKEANLASGFPVCRADVASIGDF